ncbi:fasciclin domain-containing protein [Aquimarina sp. 2201CG14-23]|uniref:fasciclin domain-containing protein n=1 Tax=Aquimarina mycalae TaxID=3040073 RepID=UPI002477D16D|nr:fasciclin domain-containing protein [Aquimarina sp. 2201CG14-23]MDH7444816.1 fasciclin domain-containing protein [Aquimarina sp. 2201CG14-23]
MKIKSSFNVLALSVVMVFASCQDGTKKNSKELKNDKLIAQANVLAKEKKVPTINEVISYDIGFTKLHKMVQSSGLENMLNGTKPYTIFAPLNGAFERLPKGAYEKLLASENKDELAAIMSCHIIPGLINEQDIIKAINERGGSVKLKTLGGTRLIASRKRGKIYLIDKNGNSGRLMKTDIETTNGMIHTLESVMLPKK